MLSLDRAVAAAASLAELLLAPFTGSPYGLRLVSDLLGYLTPGQASPDSIAGWVSQARGSAARAHRQVVADHVASVHPELSAR